MNNGFSNALLLIFRQHGDRTETIPIQASVGNSYGREGYMACQMKDYRLK